MRRPGGVVVARLLPVIGEQVRINKWPRNDVIRLSALHEQSGTFAAYVEIPLQQQQSTVVVGDTRKHTHRRKHVTQGNSTRKVHRVVVFLVPKPKYCCVHTIKVKGGIQDTQHTPREKAHRRVTSFLPSTNLRHGSTFLCRFTVECLLLLHLRAGSGACVSSQAGSAALLYRYNYTGRSPNPYDLYNIAAIIHT